MVLAPGTKLFWVMQTLSCLEQTGHYVYKSSTPFCTQNLCPIASSALLSRLDFNFEYLNAVVDVYFTFFVSTRNMGQMLPISAPILISQLIFPFPKQSAIQAEHRIFGGWIEQPGPGGLLTAGKDPCVVRFGKLPPRIVLWKMKMSYLKWIIFDKNITLFHIQDPGPGAWIWR